VILNRWEISCAATVSPTSSRFYRNFVRDKPEPRYFRGFISWTIHPWKSFFVPISLELDYPSNLPQFVEKQPFAEFLDHDRLPLIYQLLYSQPIDDNLALQFLPNKSRLQYNDSQDIVTNQEYSAQGHEKTRLRTHLKQQLISHFLEHSLNAQIMYSQYYLDENGRLVSPFSRYPQAFNRERLEDILNETRQYILAKFQIEPSKEDIEWLDQNLDYVIPILFSNEFFQTRQGLELAELMGLRRAEKMLRQAKAGDFIIIFSPYSSLRATEIAYNVTMIGEVKMENGVKVLHMTYARNTLPFEQYRQQFLHQNEYALLIYPKSAADFVSQPFVITNTNRRKLLSDLGINENQELIDLSAQAIAMRQTEIDQLVDEMMNALSVNEVKAKRLQLEQKIMQTYQSLATSYQKQRSLSKLDEIFLDQTLAGLGRGGLCGLASDLFSPVATNLNGYNFEYKIGISCQKCHRFDRPLGPCNVCDECQQKYDAGVYN